MLETERTIESIAIIGMVGYFPKANNLKEFWQNLQDGIESIADFTDEEIIASGINKDNLKNSNYVNAGAILEDIDLFDASFFDINPKEAEVTDPQHRLFLECAWEALEDAGYDSQRCESRIGVYAGASLNNYNSFDFKRDSLGSAQSYQTLIGNDKDFLATRVSYKLNLTGPSITVQTACSTSLVATNLACQSLLNYQCDLALAGGVSIRIPQKTGYLHEEGGTLSPDGHCRAFDAEAKGTTIGNGVGIVVLKRLSEAIADGDRIYAVIKGSAINNDGSGKVGYTAPSVNGQAEVIAEAIMLAGVEPETINYIEAHGTGTALGDPIEIKALTQVFHAYTQKKGFCAIGSVKTNIGHLDAAAGVAGLIKTALALKHKLIPPSLNFEQPNPQIDFANSPFYVNTKLQEWQDNGSPRRAGVSSLGIGGTNAHVVLEEAPIVPESSTSRLWQLLVLSAKTATALETTTKNLAQHLKQHPELKLADVAYTLQVGRKEFNYRRVLTCRSREEALNLLENPESPKILTHFQEPSDRPITFMFSGQGTQYLGMGRELYQSEPVFREHIERCCFILQPYLDLDLRSLLYDCQSKSEATEKLKQTAIAQPAIFVIEYATAQLWISWGISPQSAIGHSIGEYVAATLAGVMSLEDALALIATRGRMMQQMPPGAMLAVSLPASEVELLLDEQLSLSANNAPNLCVVSGTYEAIDNIAKLLSDLQVESRRLHTSHAFHSGMMDSMLEPFREVVRKVQLNPPSIPFMSNVRGTWITAEEATNPDYWVKHLRQTVRFSDGISQLLETPHRILLEVGAGRTLCTLVQQHSTQARDQVVLPSLRHPKDQTSDVGFLFNILGRLWLAGVAIDWSGFYAKEQRHRVPLPTYPFERQRYWIEKQAPAKLNEPENKLSKKTNITDWFYAPSWKQVTLVKTRDVEPGDYLVFLDECNIGSQIWQQLQQAGQNAIAISLGEEFKQLDNNRYTLNPNRSDDYHQLIKSLKQQGKNIKAIAHLWSLTPSLSQSLETTQSSAEIDFGDCFEQAQNLGFYSLLYLTQALGQENITEKIQLLVVTNQLYDLIGSESLCPEKATILGACKVIPQEYPQINCRQVDVVVPELKSEKLAQQLITELTADSDSSIIAYRGSHRWIQTFEALPLEQPTIHQTKLSQGGVYLITGGMGGMGWVFAQYLAKTVQAKLILLGRSSFPAKTEWDHWLAKHNADDNTSRKIERVRQLEALGSQVLVISANVADSEQMQNAIAQSLEQFGTIHGVIHTAGVAGGGMIQLKTPEIAESVFTPKVKGTLVLNKVLKDLKLDFLVLCSSLSSLEGGLGQVDYSAANSFLDAFARYQTANSDRFTVSINWDVWQEVGMAINTAVPQELKQWREDNLKHGFVATEAVDVLSRVLAAPLSQVIVSTRDLQAVLKQNFALSGFTDSKSDDLSQNSSIRHARPLLGNNYVAPSNDIEQTITNIWQELIGIDRIGIYDNFFELGGHSLLAVQTISRLRETFQVELPLNTLLSDSPTVAQLASVIEEKQPKPRQVTEIKQLLAQIESLSPDEIKQQLMQESNSID
jgi:acyl transferase domain-containing protein/acyl carrier protein